LSPDNVDFSILRPLWLAVVLVCATAVLFGMTFSALVARFDDTLVPLDRLSSDAPTRRRVGYLSLGWLVLAFPLLIPSILYVAGRAASHGHLAWIVRSAAVRVAGRAFVAVATVAASVAIGGAALEIL
jgi:hypothetical protein